MDVEELVDNALAESTAKLLRYFYNEKARLLAEFQESGSMVYSRNLENEYLVGQILQMKVGTVEIVDHGASKRNYHKDQTAESPAVTPTKRSKLLDHDDGYYSVSPADDYFPDEKCSSHKLRLLTTFKGDTNEFYFGKPVSVVFVPEKNCFVAADESCHFLVISPTGNVVGTFKQTKNEDYLSRCPGVVVNNGPGDFICIYDDLFLSVTSTDLTNWNFIIYPKKNRHPFCGLAVSAAHRRLYTVSGPRFMCYSATDFGFIRSWRIKPANLVDHASVLKVLDTSLFFRAAGGGALCSIPINKDGNLITNHVEEVVTGYNLICAVAFDKAGNIIIGDKNARRIDIVTPHGKKCLLSFDLSRELDCFHLSSIAYAELRNDNDRKALGANTVIVVTDSLTRRILFLTSADL